MTERSEYSVDVIEEIIMEEDLLRKLHHDERYFINDLAKIWNDTYNNVWRKLLKYKIEINKQETRYFHKVYDNIDKDKFDKMYYIEGLSGEYIAEVMNYDKKTIYKWMQLNGRPTKNYILRNYPPLDKKTCSLCKQYLPLEKFSKTNGTYDGHIARCKDCDNKISNNYKINNKALIKEKRKKRSVTIGYKINSRYRSYKERQKEKFNSDIQMSIDEVTKIIIEPCFYCGGMDVPVNGLDRVDNTKGYENGNVVSCCKKCNTMKLDLTVDEFKEKIIKIYNNICVVDKNAN